MFVNARLRFAQAPADAAAGSGTASVGEAPAVKEVEKATTEETKPVVEAKATEESPKPGDVSAEKPKADETAKAAPELEVTLPEGMVVDDALMAKFKPLAKELGLNSESASKLAALHAESAKQSATAWVEQGKKWGEELKSDTEFGGKSYDLNVAKAHEAITRFGGKQLAEALDKLGLGNFPPLVKAFAAAGKTMAEDSSHLKSTSTVKPQTEKERLASFYDHPSSQGARTGRAV